MTRAVTALVTHGELDIGTVGPFPVGSPWWSDVEPVVTVCRAVLGVNAADGSRPRRRSAPMNPMSSA